MTVRALPGFAVAVLAAGLAGAPTARGEPSCAGADPWVLVPLRADGWSEAQRAGVLLDLQRTLAGQGIDACLGGRPSRRRAARDAGHRPAARTARRRVDIEVRDAVTHKRVRRDVDLAPIPSDGRELAIAIEADELLRASWAEIALDTERARQAEPRREVVRSVDQVLAPARTRRSAALGARLAGEVYLGGNGAARRRRRSAACASSPRVALELAGGMRASPSSTAAARAGAGARRRGQPRPAAPDRGHPLRRRSTPAPASRGAGSSIAPCRSPGADASAYANLLVAARVRLIGRLALGRALAASAGLSVRRGAARVSRRPTPDRW